MLRRNWVGRPGDASGNVPMVGSAAASWPFFATAPHAISWRMKQNSTMPRATAAKIALGVALLAAATGVAFASWIDKGAGIFMATVEAGLAWCF